jgi:hypothetical protein
MLWSARAEDYVYHKDFHIIFIYVKLSPEIIYMYKFNTERLAANEHTNQSNILVEYALNKRYNTSTEEGYRLYYKPYKWQ